MPERLCATCKTPLKPGSRICRQCGATFARRKLVMPLTILVLLQILCAVAYVKYLHRNDMRTIPDPRDALHDLDPNRALPPAGWAYDDTTDPLTGNVTHHARVLGLAIPRPQHTQTHFATGTIELRQSRLYGTTAIINLARDETGQTPPSCAVRIQFDSGEPLDFTAIIDPQPDTLRLILTTPQEFISHLTSAHTISAAASIPGIGERVASFQVGNLNWASPSPLSIAAERTKAWVTRQTGGAGQ